MFRKALKTTEDGKFDRNAPRVFTKQRDTLNSHLSELLVRHKYDQSIPKSGQRNKKCIADSLADLRKDSCWKLLEKPEGDQAYWVQDCHDQLEGLVVGETFANLIGDAAKRMSDKCRRKLKTSVEKDAKTARSPTTHTALATPSRTSSSPRDSPDALATPSRTSSSPRDSPGALATPTRTSSGHRDSPGALVPQGTPQRGKQLQLMKIKLRKVELEQQQTRLAQQHNALEKEIALHEAWTSSPVPPPSPSTPALAPEEAKACKRETQKKPNTRISSLFRNRPVALPDEEEGDPTPTPASLPSEIGHTVNKDDSEDSSHSSAASDSEDEEAPSHVATSVKKRSAPKKRNVGSVKKSKK